MNPKWRANDNFFACYKCICSKAYFSVLSPPSSRGQMGVGGVWEHEGGGWTPWLVDGREGEGCGAGWGVSEGADLCCWSGLQAVICSRICCMMFSLESTTDTMDAAPPPCGTCTTSDTHQTTPCHTSGLIKADHCTHTCTSQVIEITMSHTPVYSHYKPVSLVLTPQHTCISTHS